MTKVINFDELKKPAAVAIVIDGERHEMVEASVETFIENMKAIEALGTNASPIQEIEAGIGIITRAFPTIPAGNIRKWTLTQIQTLSDLARGVSGEVVSTDEAKIAEANASGNVQTAN